MIRVNSDCVRRSALATALVTLVVLIAAPARAQAPRTRVIPGRYIVVLKNPAANPGAVAAQMARAHGAAFDRVYGAALNGFAGTIPPGRLAAVKADPRVAYVEPDQVVEMQGKLEALGKPGGGGGVGGGGGGEVVPSGVRRIYGTAPIPALVDVNVAVIDTGIQSNHPDLNVLGGVDFTRNRKGYQDGNGHGTHVSGTIAAKKNGIGVVGVAPGAGLYAVKVLNDQGSGQYSWVIAGIDWVATNADAKNIRVANMSLGGGGSQAVLDALDRAVSSGVAFSVAAGNNSVDCRNTSPANSTNLGVNTVSALCDSDGLPGGGGVATSYGADDTFASFSNNGRNETISPDPTGNGVDVIAPGVNIYSTYKGGGYATMSGTSMASPHVAGVAALVVAGQPMASPTDIKLALLISPGTGGWGSYIYFDSLVYYFGLDTWRARSGDLDSGGQLEGYEPLVNAAAFMPTP